MDLKTNLNEQVQVGFLLFIIMNFIKSQWIRVKSVLCPEYNFVVLFGDQKSWLIVVCMP